MDLKSKKLQTLLIKGARARIRIDIFFACEYNLFSYIELLKKGA